MSIQSLPRPEAHQLRGAARHALPRHAVFVAGDWAAGSGDEHVHHDPASGDVLGTWTLAGVDQVELAMGSAACAQQQWTSLSGAQRRDGLTALAAVMAAGADTLAGLMTLEMGMPLKASRAGVQLAIDWFRHFAGYADKIEGVVQQIGAASAGLDYTRCSPVGVVLAIIPWNGPMAAMALKVAPALAAGNAVVLKPSELAPFSTLHFGSMVSAAGLPAGLVNVLPGGAELGARLCRDPGVDLISFTGGPIAGRDVATTAAARHLPVVLELGGKSASLIFADADVDRSARLAAVFGIAQNSGQGCFLPTRLLVERAVYDRVLDGVVAAAKHFRLGDPFDSTTTMGPAVNRAARERIVAVIERAVRCGEGRLVLGQGNLRSGELPGNFVEPTVFAEVDPSSGLAQDEIFGPVLSMMAFDDEQQAVELANGTRYGLAGYVWTRDIGRAHRVAAALDAGYVSVNGMAGLAPQAPFGGWKESGHRVEGGRAGLAEFLRTKNVHVQW